MTRLCLRTHGRVIVREFPPGDYRAYTRDDELAFAHLLKTGAAVATTNAKGKARRR